MSDDAFLLPGVMTDVGPLADRVAAIPDDLPSIVAAVQGLLIHEFLGPLYDIEIDQGSDAVNLHRAADILALAGDAPLTEPRDPSDRVPSNCRQFSVVTTAILRAHGIAARARCGFGAYFNPGYLEDHWVAEVRSPTTGRWHLVDAQIDDVQRRAMGIDLDTMDVPRDRFVVAGDAWLGFRAGTVDPDRCGLSVIDEHGDWWIAQNLLRDVASLLGVETRPWDVWGAMREPGDPIPPTDVDLFDHLAALTVGGAIGGHPSDEDLAALAASATTDPRVRVPAEVFNASRHRMEHLPEGAAQG
ncbi:MAG: transglutaminase domain-containing protein [Actinobacteria bacterium]|nr:transglutaminase domain-containing protein [Actinomycetota bacterium]